MSRSAPAPALVPSLVQLGASAALVRAEPGAAPVYVAVNAGHAALAGRPPSELEGGPFPAWSGEAGERIAAALRVCLADRRPHEVEHRVSPAGDVRWWRTVAVPLLEGDAPATSALVLSIEITEQHWIEARLRAELAELIGELELQASTDSLTGAANRRSTMRRIDEEVARARRHGRPLSVLMMDLDRFKAINDAHGHATGDEVLRVFAAEVARALRPSDLVGRVGGEEFVVVLPETGGAGAAQLAERLRARTSALSVHTEDGPVHVTVSIGVASLEDGQAGRELLAAADDALYEAKREGRDRVSWAELPPLSPPPDSR
jgi:diguanylate cyclase (GGDEF)-like protein